LSQLPAKGRRTFDCIKRSEFSIRIELSPPDFIRNNNHPRTEAQQIAKFDERPACVRL